MKIGEAYKTIPKVFSINIVYFSLGQGKGYAYHGTTRFKNMFNPDDELKLTTALDQRRNFGFNLTHIFCCLTFFLYFLVRNNLKKYSGKN